MRKSVKSRRKPSKRKVAKKSKRKTRRKTVKRRKLYSKKNCKSKLSRKIKINMKEYKSGRYKSRQQALAVSYSQIKKKYPRCKRFFKKV
jgi:hypothetical protein